MHLMSEWAGRRLTQSRGRLLQSSRRCWIGQSRYSTGVGRTLCVADERVLRVGHNIISAPPWWTISCRGVPLSRSLHTKAPGSLLTIQDQRYQLDKWFNVPEPILDSVGRKLHLQKHHPISITRQLIESKFPRFKTYNDFFPIVSTHQNFDALNIPIDHPGRSRSDTYYVNAETLLRTHTSAHQDETFRANESDGWLISADVYRRDAIDRSHYPIFHQMEGAMTWDRTAHNGNITDAVLRDLASLPTHSMVVEDLRPFFSPEANPLQSTHTVEECNAVVAHLKRSFENVVAEIFSRARIASGASSADAEPLQVRWVEAYFPFTSPSWELEIFWNDQWLEVVGCGVVQQQLLTNAGQPDRVGWAFGLGLERLAMLLFDIPDIRLFWSHDERFLSQFVENQPISRFQPFSKYPVCFKDVSFWLPSEARDQGSTADGFASETFHENDLMEIVRGVAGNLAEDVRLVDEFVQPKTGRRSICYRVLYRSLERTLTNDEVNKLHEKVCLHLESQHNVSIR